ncbi:MAG TPA: LuxR C-terminal-related transcriptional regulator [Cyclobacteriaceae bacterium]|nr:LuxR C-terminal-related transcriptional regulator [Cyclobacteriaceae bacterium]
MKEDFLKIGKDALAVGAWEEARSDLERAVQSEPSAEALEELAWAYWWLNDMPRVFELRTQAHHAYLEKNDKQGASRTASWLGLTYLEYNGEFAIASGWFQRAENLLEGIDRCKERCLIQTLKANLSFRIEKNIPQALSLLDDTIALSKSLDAVGNLMIAEALKGFILVTKGMVREGMQLLDEATLLAMNNESGDIHSITTTCCFLIDACQRARDFDRAGQWCLKVQELCMRWRHKAVFATCRTQYASVLIWKGEWQEADRELTTAIDELKKLRPVGVNAGILRLADLRRRQGRWTEAATLFDEIKSAGPKALPCAALLYDTGEFKQAYDMTDRFLRQVPPNEKTERVAGLELFIQINVKLGQLDEAEKSLNELKEIAATIDVLPFRAAYLNAKGSLNYGLGNYELSRKDLEDAIDLYEQILSPFEAARARVALARALDKLRDHGQAEHELNKAISVFKTLGAKRDLEKSRQQLRELGVNTTNEQGFTKRELAILRLVAEGKSNEQISDTLCISLRTVEKHLSNIYQKLGTSGKSARAHAASFASRNLPSR